MKKLLTILLVLCLIFVAGLYIFWNSNIGPVNSATTETKSFTVAPGSSVRAIATKLEAEGLIKNDVAFLALVRLSGINLQAGTFSLSPSMSAEQIARTMTRGTDDIRITIPEGKRATEIAAMLQAMPNYDDSWIGILEENEGYLFPETYDLPRTSTIEEIVTIMRDHFEAKYETISNATTLSKEEIVTLASMIEREARHDEDRPLVSSVMHNRLEIGMALQIDATVQYALGYDDGEQTWWKKGITLEDLDIASPYNTYENPGLPPSPIANPGLPALQAAANPAESDYLFYITDKTGVNRYARTNTEHNENIRKYGL